MDTQSQLIQEPHLAEEQIPAGFRFSAVRAGIKASGRTDLACAVSDSPATAAALFTSNQIVAAPLIVGRRNLARMQGRMRAIVVNAGNANCATGEPGILAAQRVCAKAGELFGCSTEEIFPSSTGIIGVPLPEQKIIDALPAAVAALGRSATQVEDFARAIMTTDTRMKIAGAGISLRGKTVRVAGIAKGAGMIYPQLAAAPHATMLVYLFTDALVEPKLAGDLLHEAVETTFNRISIDGDTSTNDTVLLLASGASGVAIESGASGGTSDPSSAASESLSHFSAALREVCLSLAKQIVADGEGIEHVVELNVRGTLSDSDALRVARSIANSPLVKTSWAGCDPNWGRILAAIGYAGVPVNPALIDIYLGDQQLCSHGGVSPSLDKSAAHEYLKQRELSIRIELGLGNGSCRFWTTDLTAEYVHINADYST